ncbi:hypothetical protein PVAP13_1NG287419 [Panicum virgatum]|uniref:Uncharacterized protein n=1 Tax=Panicum virgatum TaxID=38727 RepID=A0A8T0X7K2_PANVG|nr:hypothetical protein PVAP13_1NG287419 [Panicum virgatum]
MKDPRLSVSHNNPVSLSLSLSLSVPMDYSSGASASGRARARWCYCRCFRRWCRCCYCCNCFPDEPPPTPRVPGSQLISGHPLLQQLAASPIPPATSANRLSSLNASSTYSSSATAARR